jgi:hypothetical protein
VTAAEGPFTVGVVVNDPPGANREFLHADPRNSPIFDGKFAENVNVNPSAAGIMFNEIGKVGRESGNFTETFDQGSLFDLPARLEHVKNFNGDEQTRVAHGGLGQSQFALELMRCKPAIGSLVVTFSRQFRRVFRTASVFKGNHERDELATLLGGEPADLGLE